MNELAFGRGEIPSSDLDTKMDERIIENEQIRPNNFRLFSAYIITSDHSLRLSTELTYGRAKILLALNSVDSFQHNYHVFDHSPRDGFNFI